MKHLPSRLLVASLLCAASLRAAAETPAVVPPSATAPAGSAGEKLPEKVLPEYVRMAEDDKAVRMEVAVTTFTLPDGRTVDLFGVVHLGDASYYKDINQRLAAYDAVLFELVGNPEGLQNPDPAALPPARPNPLRGMQKTIGDLFKLEFQLEKIDYTRPNFVHADTTAEEFAKMQAERGESMIKMLLKSFQLSGDPALREKMKDAENLGLADLVMLFYSEKAMQRIKVIFARLLADSESLLEGQLLGENNAIIDGRNEVALRKLDEVLADPAKKRTAIFYGAGHMPGMEQDLRDRLKAVRTTEVWLPAWTMPAPAKSKPRTSTEPAPEPDKSKP